MAARAAVTKEDRQAVTAVDALLRQFAADAKHHCSTHTARLDNVLLRMADRGDRFLSSELRLRNLSQLLQRGTMADRFVKELLSDSATQLNDAAQEVVDWLAEKSERQGQEVSEYLLLRAQRHSGDMVSKLSSQRYKEDRAKLLQKLAPPVRSAAAVYSDRQLARDIANSMYSTMAQVQCVLMRPPTDFFFHFYYFPGTINCSVL